MNVSEHKYELALYQLKFSSSFEEISTVDIGVPILVCQYFFEIFLECQFWFVIIFSKFFFIEFQTCPIGDNLANNPVNQEARKNFNSFSLQILFTWSGSMTSCIIVFKKPNSGYCRINGTIIGSTNIIYPPLAVQISFNENYIVSQI